MSALLAGFIQLGWGIGFNDDSLQPPDYRYYNYPTTFADTPLQYGVVWPFPRLLGGGSAAGYGFDIAPPQQWEYGGWWTGHHRRAIVSGVVYSAPGVPAAGATVMLFNWTGVLVDQGVTDVNGNYSLGDPNLTDNFVVAQSSDDTMQGVTTPYLEGS
jgi:hypothetical protein